MNVEPLPSSLSAVIVPLYNRKPESRAAGRARTRLVYAIESIENVGEIRLRNSDARIGYANDRALAGTDQARLNGAAARRIFDRVVDYIVNHLLELDCVAGGFQCFLRRAFQLNAVLARERGKALDLFQQQLVKINVAQAQLHAAAVDIDQRKQVGNDSVQAIDFLIDI